MTVGCILSFHMISTTSFTTKFNVTKVGNILSHPSKANQYRKSSETVTTGKHLFTVRNILGQRPWPLILLFYYATFNRQYTAQDKQAVALTDQSL